MHAFCLHTYTHTQTQVHTHMYTYTNAHAHTYTHTHTHTHTHSHTYTYARTYTQRGSEGGEAGALDAAVLESVKSRGAKVAAMLAFSSGEPILVSALFACLCACWSSVLYFVVLTEGLVISQSDLNAILLCLRLGASFL